MFPAHVTDYTDYIPVDLFIQFMHQDTFSLTLHRNQKIMLFNGLLIMSNRSSSLFNPLKQNISII